jgi:Undecaprenyl-phosphate glucose phosphotransferase
MTIGIGIGESSVDSVKSSEISQDAARIIISPEAVPYAAALLDALIIMLSSLSGAFLYHWMTDQPLQHLSVPFASGLFAGLIYVIPLSGRGYYDFERVAQPGVEIVRILFSWCMTVLLLAFLAFLVKIAESFSRGSFLLFVDIAAVGLIGGRRLAKNIISSAIDRGVLGRRFCVLVGDPAELAALEGRDMLPYFGSGAVDRFSLTEISDPTERQKSDETILQAVTNFARMHNSSEILLALPWHDMARIGFIRSQLKMLPASIRLLPDVHVRGLTNSAGAAGQKSSSIEIQRAPLNSGERLLKRTGDVALAFFALMFAAPMMVVIALAVRLNGPGPIIFRQTRKGFNGKPFVMFKFRTMTVQENGASVTQASRNDPRVTRIGKWLRATSLDELPQLVNVLRGEMSLIGPRPHALAHDDQFEKMLEDYAYRHHVKPGLTGWAQVHGLRGATPTVALIDARVKMDLWYINNWSPWLDIQILFKTVVEVLRKRNAY